MPTITKQNKFTKNLRNEKLSLLNYLRKANHSSQLLSQLKELLITEEFKDYSLESAELIAIIAMLPKADQFKALEFIKNNSDILLSAEHIKKLKVYLSKEQDFTKLLALFSKLNFKKLLATIEKCNLNSRLEKFKALTKQYKVNFSSSASLKGFFSLFPESDLLELVKTPQIWDYIRVKFAEIGKRPALPLNQKETLMLLKKLGEIYNFQAFLRDFSVANKNDQFNLFFQFQQRKPKLITEYLKTSQNIIELLRLIPEASVSNFFQLPIIISAIDKGFFSWDHIISMLNTLDNGGVYLFIDHLCAKNKLTEALDIEQLKILLVGKDVEKRLDFFNSLKSKHLISSEIYARDNRLVELFPENLDNHLNNNTSKYNILFFGNKIYKRQLSLPTIDEECDENNSVNKKFKSEVNQYLNRHI